MDEESDVCEEYSVLVDDDSAFQVGESFRSYDELVQRLNDHCERSLVRYARRDTKSVRFAAKKMDKRVNPNLVYYVVRYGCVYGGRKVPSRSRAIRPRKRPSSKVDCPAYISLRASKCGQRLEVSSVQNVHNHPISKELFKKMYHCRRIPMELRKQVADLHTIGARKKFLMKYLQANSGIDITSKHYFNMISRNKRSIMDISNERIKELFEIIEKEDPEEYNAVNKELLFSIIERSSLDIKMMKTEYESQNEHQSDVNSTDQSSSEDNPNKIKKMLDMQYPEKHREKNVLSDVECVYMKDETKLINEHEWNVVLKKNDDESLLQSKCTVKSDNERNQPLLQNDAVSNKTIKIINNKIPKIIVKTLTSHSDASQSSQDQTSESIKLVKLPKKYSSDSKCLSCGKFAKETREFINNLKKERDELIKETAYLMLLRDRLKDEISHDNTECKETIQ